MSFKQGWKSVLKDTASHNSWEFIPAYLSLLLIYQSFLRCPFQLVTGRVWQGTAFGGAKGRTDVPKIVDWYMEGKIDINNLVTHTMDIDEINDAFDLMHQGKSIRSVITF